MTTELEATAELMTFRAELEEIQIEKEPLWQSERFRVFLTGVVLELLILLKFQLQFQQHSKLSFLP